MDRGGPAEVGEQHQACSGEIQVCENPYCGGGIINACRFRLGAAHDRHSRSSIRETCLLALGVVIQLQFTTDVPNIAALSKIAGSSECPDISFTSNRGRLTVLDQKGLELANIEEAAQEATRRGREIAAREGRNAATLPSTGLIIIDEGWRTVLELPF